MASSSLEYVEELFADYLDDPALVPPEWRKYFETLAPGEAVHHAPRFRTSFRPGSVFNPPVPNQGPDNGQNAAISAAALQIARLQERVDQLIRNYRVRGHRIASIDPLGRTKAHIPELQPEYFGFTEAHMQQTFSTRIFGNKVNEATLAEIVLGLHNTYCRTIGAQFMHIDELPVREWLQNRMEATENHINLSRTEQIRILTRLTDAVIFEEFIRKKFLGAKSFSLEGAESLIPLLDLTIEKAARQGVAEIVFGMAHRGRLNVLANIIGKSPLKIFREFEDKDPHLHWGGGDVKYHLGHSSDWTTAEGKKVHLTLCFNPSHLEYVNPVVLGRARAKQERAARNNPNFHRSQILPILIHGDAAFAGEGIVQETLNLSQLPNYTTGGTLHVIVNNQIGFTTPPDEGRSCTYASDVAKMLQIPIFHVNGEDPEAVAQVVDLAMDFRQRFQRDVVIDMYAFRRWGHNESDEPTFTQPLLYEAIARRKPVRESYLEYVLELGSVTREEADKIAEERQGRLEIALNQARQQEPEKPPIPGGVWQGYTGGREPDDEKDTGVAQVQLSSLLEKMSRPPDGFHLHKKLERWLDKRLEMARGQAPLDWAAAEALALASLAVEGYPIRFGGQDAPRATFSQRHAVWHDTVDGHTYAPLKHLAPNQAQFEIFNSPLSEAGVLGFDYGYSLDTPDGLTVWEAQFGDFWNVAQVIVDQFIVSAEDKWRRLSGLTLLLPHGYEGQGPEHSSARIERFLLMAAEHNIQVAQPSSPAQYYHLLRRQMTRSWRKPLVVFTPKSLLRHPRVVSPLADCTQGRFQRILPDIRPATDVTPTRLLLCSGRVYYDLLHVREERQRDDVAIARLEQFYPFPEQDLRNLLAGYPEGLPVFWVQDEPENMGVWRFLRIVLGERIFGRFPLSLISREESSSPATGSSTCHKMEQQEILDQAFGQR